jgi:hypothetical protein
MTCDLDQGFHLAEPLDPQGVADLLSRQAAGAAAGRGQWPWKAAPARRPSGDTGSVLRNA